MSMIAEGLQRELIYGAAGRQIYVCWEGTVRTENFIRTINVFGHFSIIHDNCLEIFERHDAEDRNNLFFILY